MRLKNHIFLVLSMTAVLCVKAQTPFPLPPNYFSGYVVNYVKTWDVRYPKADATGLLSTDVVQTFLTAQYFDGLGRHVQTVERNKTIDAFNNKVDLVTPVYYDLMGREQFRYLPFASVAVNSGDATSDGSFKRDPFQQQQNCYNNYLIGQANEVNGGTNWAYNKANFETSPLGRVINSYAPGVNWVGTEGTTQHGIYKQYMTNTLADNVQMWNCAVTPGAIPVSAGAYPAGTLYKEITVDENGNYSQEYKDIEGKLILKQVELVPEATGWLSTYYIYDDLNDLRYVLQPKAVELMANSFNWNVTAFPGLLTELAFYFEYDLRKRVVKKQTPGKTPQYFVYDSRDREVMNQDGNTRQAGQWLVKVYDGFDREVKSGLLNDATTTFATHTSNAYSAAIQSDGSSYPSTASNFTLETQKFFDDYNWRSSTPLSGGFDGTQSGSGFLAASDVTAPFARAVTPTTYSSIGLLTGTMSAELGTPSQYSARSLYTANYYDDRNRILQAQSVNVTGGIDIRTSQYSFEGKVLVQKVSHSKQGTNSQAYVQLTTMTYDDAGRLSSNTKTVSGTVSTTKPMVVTYNYDPLERISRRNLFPPPNSFTGIDYLAYQYNIRGWMTMINPQTLPGLSNTRAVFPSSGLLGGQIYFTEEIAYDKTTSSLGGNSYTKALFNGDIAGITWGSAGDFVARKYDFAMDQADRLTAANYTQQLPSGGWGGGGSDPNPTPDFRMNASYDANGNILGLNQYGWQATGSSAIDQLTYTYNTNTNRLKNVIEGMNNPTTQFGDFHYSPTYTTNLGGAKPATATDYSYNINGDLTGDLNKDITSITYNYLDLPQTITVANKGTINFVYDAMGNKLQKITSEPNGTLNFFGNNLTTAITTITTYDDDKVYQTLSYSNPALSFYNYTDKAQFFMNDEGRFRFLYDQSTNALTGIAGDYFERDHLGNTRIVLTDEQATDYYPPTTLEGSTSDPNSAVGFEEDLYNIDPGFIVPSNQVMGLPAYTNTNGMGTATYPQGNSGLTTMGNNSQNVYRINGTQNKMGLGIAIKVMEGDVINVFGKAYYNGNNTNDNSSYFLPMIQVLTAFLSSPNLGVVAGDHPIVPNAGAIGGRPEVATSMNSFMTNSYNPYVVNPPQRPNSTSTTPRAYVNWILLDNQFNFVSGGFSQVGAPGTLTDFSTASALHNVTMFKSGYLYVYCSNESPMDVYFDNIQVVHSHGPFLEETHYYPFGLAMEGICDRAVKVGYVENKYRFNKGSELQNREFSNGSGLDLYTTHFRQLDPQLGRWWQEDPKPIEDESPYASMRNNPFLKNDPMGDFGDYYDEKGNRLASDGINDHRNYVIKTTTKTEQMYDPKVVQNKGKSNPISQKAADATKAKIKAHQFNDPVVQANIQELKSSDQMNAMIKDIASKDDVNNGVKITDPSKNREYSGDFVPGGVKPAPPGPVHTVPGGNVSSGGVHDYHSHPSGVIVYNGGLWPYEPAPSGQDINIARDRGATHYVVSVSNSTIYIYNGSGVVATIPNSTHFGK